MDYNSWQSLLSWEVAAAGIKNFFETISERAKGEWLSNNPQQYLQVVKGDLKLDFFSELEPISWAIVAEVAERLRRSLDLGLMGMFDMRLIAPTGTIIYVHLRVGNALAAGAA